MEPTTTGAFDWCNPTRKLCTDGARDSEKAASGENSEEWVAEVFWKSFHGPCSFGPDGPDGVTIAPIAPKSTMTRKALSKVWAQVLQLKLTNPCLQKAQFLPQGQYI